MHVPVLQNEVIKYLAPRPNENFIDCTIGDGGHALSIIEKILPDGKVLGIDWDKEVIHRLKRKAKSEKRKNNLIFVCDNFANLKKIVEQYKFSPINGILLDLGMSSWHLEESGRGFSFLRDEPLVMRYDWLAEAKSLKRKAKNFTLLNFIQKFERASSEKLKTLLTAQEIVNTWSEKEIERILREYGEERFAKSIAKEIVKTREKIPIRSTLQLVGIIRKAVPNWEQHRKLHFATKTFQSLRIAVNEELENLQKVLPRALEILERDGRLVIISFHSLEDRIVKNFFREKTKSQQIKIITKKPITAQKSEIILNFSSRSAKLRAAQKI